MICSYCGNQLSPGSVSRYCGGCKPEQVDGDTMGETISLAEDLQPGDEVVSTAICGYSGIVDSVMVGPGHTVRVDFRGGGAAYLCSFEVCDVRRPTRVHPLFATILRTHGVR